jgi:chemotaxis signal transduction protein
VRSMDDKTQERLAERTRRYGAAVETKATSREHGRYVGFRVRETVLGVPVAMVSEFAALEHWVPLGGQSHVLGVAQLRGEVMALVDLFEALTGSASEIGDWLVVLQGRGGRTAAPVSEVLGTRSVLESDLVPRDQVPPLCPAVTAATSDLWHLLDGAALAAALDAGVKAASGPPASTD